MDTRSPLHVLIVDAEDEARAYLARLLSALDIRCHVDEAPDGRTAIEHIWRRRVDLVLLEVRLPDLDGFEFVRTVGVDSMPLFAFTTTCDAHAFEAFGVGAIGYLVKPVPAEQLTKLVTRAARWPR